MPLSEEKLEELVGQFLTIARAKLSGTLRVSGSETRRKLFLFQQGHLADIDTGREDTVLVAALVGTGAFSEKDLRRARKAAARSGAALGAELAELGVLPEEELAEAIRRQLTLEACEVFRGLDGAIELFEHGPDERLEGFASELSDLFEVLVDPEDLLLEATRELARWDLVERHFHALHDVVYATPGSFRYFREQAAYPAEHAILSRADGVKDVSEVIAESGIDPFEALMLVRRLQAENDLELINPVQMYQLGVECAAQGDPSKAARLFQRAHERGLDDFDLQLNLAQALEAAGRIAEALERYIEFGEKCTSQLRIDDAIRSFRRALKLDPRRLEVREKILELLIAQNRSAEAVEEAVGLAQKRSDAGSPRAGLDLLVRVRSLNPRDVKLRQMIIDLAEACGDQPLARAEREVLAKACEERKDIELALETYQKMFCDGKDSVEVRLKLVELHRSKGNRQKALDHLNALLNLPEKKRIKDEALVVSLHEMVRELKPSDLRSNRWLADHYSRTGEREKAARLLASWIGHLEAEGDLAEAVHAYERLLGLDDRHEHRWGLAKALEKLGRLAECRRELRSLANLAIRKKEFDAASKALEHILKTAPLDVETRKMQAELYEALEKPDVAAVKHEEVALLSLLSGDVQAAEQHCRRVPAERPGAAELARRLGRLCLEQGDRRKAVEQVLKSAKLHLQARNLGLCRTALDELGALEPANAEAVSLRAELKALEPVPPASQGTGQAPHAVPPPPPPPPPQPALAPAPSSAVAAPSAAPAAPAAQGAHGTPTDPTAPTAQAAQAVVQAPRQDIDREPFQPARPVKTNVAGIMARLKRLKAAPPGDPLDPAPAAAAEVSAAAPGAAPPHAESEGAQQSSSAALSSAASRLRALAGRKAQEAGHAAPADTPAPPPVQPPAPGPRSGLPADAPAGDAATAAAPAPADALTAVPFVPAAAPADAEEAPPAEGAPVAAVKRLKLAGPASRLAALRKQGVS
ncbi:MAG: tetratricopeptide repeat protein [Planctomycetes bacterium]|nr:tetratricopeptide repeat protein [Planctomycetota bacterium]